MSILTSGLRANAPDEPRETTGNSVFGQALRNGAMQSGAGLAALGGTALESVGADTLGKKLHNVGAGLREDAAANPLAINSYKQVDGVGSALEYGVGLLGQSAPMLGAGLAGALTTRSPLVGATLASAPLMAGDVANRQQEDAEIAALPAPQRLGSAITTGLAGAALSNAVPVMMGGKLLGNGISQAGMGLGRNIATNVGEAVLGNAAGGVGAEALTQNALTQMNPNRDTSMDNDALWEAGVGGAAMGVPFAGAGIAGQARHGTRLAPRTDGVPVPKVGEAGPRAEAPAGVYDAPNTPPSGPDAGKGTSSLTERVIRNRRAVSDEFTPPVPSLAERVRNAFTKNDDAAEMDLVDRIAKNQETIDVDTLRNTPPSEHGMVFEQADNSRMEKVKSWAQKMYEDASLSPEARAAVDDFMANPTDRAKQAAVAGMKMASAATEKATTAAKDFYDKMTARFKSDESAAPTPVAKAARGTEKSADSAEGVYAKAAERFRGEGQSKGTGTRPPTNVKFSDMDSPKLHSAMADTISTSLARNWPDLVKNDAAMKTITGGLRRVMDGMIREGTVDGETASQLRSWFGKDAPSVMAALHSSVLDTADTAATARYYEGVKALDEHVRTARSMESHVRDALPPEVAKNASREQLSEMVRSLREHFDGKDMTGKPKAQVEFETAQIEASLREHFGDKTDALMKAFIKDAESRFEAGIDEEGQSLAMKEAVNEIDPEQGRNVVDADEVEAGLEATQYHGSGKDKATPVRSPEAHRAEFNNESQAERLIKELKGKNPDRTVEFVHIRDMDPAEQAKYPDAGPDDGFVTVRGEKSETSITPDELQAMRVDTNKTSHAQNNPSRIDTGVHGAVLDARAIVKHMQGKLEYNESDGLGKNHRTARAFMEGIAAIQDHLGKAFEIDDSVVIAPNLTYGEAKALSMRPRDPQWMKGLTTEEINTQLNKREALAEMSDIELNKTAGALAGRMEAFVGKQLADWKEMGIRFTKKDVAALRARASESKVGEAFELANKEMTKRQEGRHSEKVLEGEGRTEVGTDDNIHRAAQANGEQALVRRTSLDDSPLHASNFEQFHPDGKLKTSTINAIDSKIKRMETMKTSEGRENRIAMRLAVKAKVLHANMDKMRVSDQAMLASIVKDRSIASISETINDLYSEYAAKFNKQDAPTGGFPTDLKTRSALAEIGKELKKPPSDLTARYEQLLSTHLSLGKSADTFARAYATGARIPLKAAEAISKLYKAEGAEPKKASAFVERVLGEGDISDISAAIKKSDDHVAVRRVVDSLGDHLDNPRAREVMDAANDRLTKMIEADPDIAYSMQRVDPNVQHVGTKLGDVAKHIDDVLGGSVDLMFKKMLHAGEFEKATKYNNLAKDTIRVSVFSMDPMSTAHHESLHAFLSKLRDQGLMPDAHPLMKAADSMFVKNKLRELLANEPGALKQTAANLEERAAYMYQFWAAGKLNLPARPAGVLGHLADFFRNVMGIWTNDQRATHIMEYFNSGEYKANMGDRSAVARALGEGTNTHVEKFKAMIEPLSRLADTVVATGNGRIRGTMIPALLELADKVHSPMQGASDDPGYIPAARVKRAQVMNSLADRVGGYSPAVLTEALTSMQRGEKGASPEVRLAMREVKDTLQEMRGYMIDAGVELGDLGPDYFPRAWDASTILSNEKAFRDMMQHYVDKGDFVGSVDQVIATLTRTDGSELQVETVRPGMQNTKARILGFISHRDAEPFLRKNLYDTLNSYVSQATRRAEWSRRFNDDSSGLYDLFNRARDEGATDADVQMASDFLQGVDGTLGDKINPDLRRAFGNMVVYQNIRVLPLAIFSSVIDPMGVLVRGGTVGEAFNTMKRGFTEISKGFKKGAAHDDATILAATLGVIDNAVLMHSIGSTYSQGMTSNFGRRVNDVFFKYNLMEQFNVSMRVGASEAAIGFLARHADGTNSSHSTRWLAELGLKPNEVVVKNGRPLLTEAEFLANGMKPDEAKAAADKMSAVVNKWVDGAVLRPNAAHKPVWMNDPHFAVIAHLKQFVYAFQETILKRVANEARHGNVGPAYALAAYVPFMLAADLAKGVIVSGGSQPASRESWDVADYAFYEVQRAGLFGVGQFGLDMAKDVQRGGMGIGALAGPTLEQLGDAVSVVAGPRQFETFAMDALPANALFDATGKAVDRVVE